jgi:hypothetical protein
MPRKRAFIPSEDLQVIRAKIEDDPSGGTLSPAEKKREVVKDEAAYLLSALAGREISQRYIKELIREDKGPRLRPVRVVGNTFFYRVSDLLRVRFNKMAQEPESAEGEEGSATALQTS